MTRTYEQRLDTLRLAFERRAAEEEKIVKLVAAARQNGLSWTAIGEAMSMSRQAAWKRYKHVEDKDFWDWDAHKGGPEIHTATCSSQACNRPAKWHVIWVAGCCHLCGSHRRQMESTGLGVRSVPLD